MGSAAAGHRVRGLLSTRRTLLADVERARTSAERLLALSDVSGTDQLYELVSGELIQLTSLPEPVASAHYVPGIRGDSLLEASPLTHADAIRAPLFVIHGRNDPRVPVGEAEQLVAGLVERGVRCELLIYEDVGHGLARLNNQLDAYPRAIDFLSEVLAPARSAVRP